MKTIVKKNELTAADLDTLAETLPARPVFDLTIGIRRLHSGQFGGLWEAYLIDAKGTQKKVAEATSREMMMNKVRQSLMRMV